MSFGEQLATFAAKTQAKANTVVRKVVLDLGVSVVMKSPVGDASYWKSPPPAGYVGGHFRANWQYGTGSAPSGIKSGVDTSPGGSVTIGALVQDLSPDALGKVHYIANNVPYAQRLEDGWSRQAPNGVVSLTVQEFQSIVEEAVREAGE